MGDSERPAPISPRAACADDHCLPSIFRAADGYSFYYRLFSPTGTAKARLIFVHGIRSHGGWYTRSCRRFAEAGFEVYLLERRGSGLNTSCRGDSPSFRQLLDDVADFAQHVRARQAWLPNILCGISWGGKLAVGLPYRRPGLINGLVLLCPGLVPKVAPPFFRRMQIAVARVFRPEKFFPIPLNDPELFTSSPHWQKYIADEARGLRQATARFLFGSFSLDIYLRRAARRVKVPTLLVLGGRDRVVDNQRTRQFVGLFDTTTSIIDYPEAHHTLEFEHVDHPWIEDVQEWIERRVVRLA